MKVLLCGGGNAIHVLTAYVSSLPNVECNILSLFPGEAERLRNSIPEAGVKCINDLGADVYGKPVLVSDDVEAVAAGADVVIFAVPSFTHDLYLKALKYVLRPGVILGAMPGEGGFDLVARNILGNEFVNASSLFALETLPWACRILDYGKAVEVLGTKAEIDVAITPKVGDSVEHVLKVLQTLVGRLPVMKPASNFLAVTLMNINSVWHPTISWGFYNDKDVTQLFDEQPLFYQGADEKTGNKLAAVSDEVIKLRDTLVQKFPGLDLSSTRHVREWMLRSYGDDIGDKTSIYTMLQTNKGYRGLTHPMVTVDTPEGKKYAPNFKYRYFTEDLPCGLIVTRGIAELAGVPMPEMDDVIMWCQKVMNKEFLVDGKLTGKDVAGTRAPQNYGYKTIEDLVKQNHYQAVV